MRIHKPRVKLTEEERIQLEDIFKKGVHSASKTMRAKVLLELDSLNYYSGGLKFRPTIKGIALKCGVSEATVRGIMQRYLDEGLEATLARKKRETPPIKPIVTGDVEARIIALACSAPPKGHARWTLRLLEKKVVELGIVEKISDNTIGRMLKKMNLSLT